MADEEKMIYDPSTQKRGLGSKNFGAARRKEIASMGGKAAQEKGTAHKWTPDECRYFGRIGGINSARKRAGLPLFCPPPPPPPKPPPPIQVESEEEYLVCPTCGNDIDDDKPLSSLPACCWEFVTYRGEK